MRKPKFKKKENVQDYFNDYRNIARHKFLTEDGELKGIFDPIFFLNLLHEQFEIVKINKDKPLSVVQHLQQLKLNDIQLYFLLSELLNMIKDDAYTNGYKDKKLKICSQFIVKEFIQVAHKLYPSTYPSKKIHFDLEAKHFDFDDVMTHVSSIKENSKKIEYLINEKKKYLLQDIKAPKTSELTFDKKCDLEIEHINSLMQPTSADSELITEHLRIKLSNRTAAKTDLIRVLNALFELHFFESPDGGNLTKKDFMKRAGNFFGTKLTKYHTNLSQSYKDTPLDVNLKIFEKMKKITTDNHSNSKL